MMDVVSEKNAVNDSYLEVRVKILTVGNKNKSKVRTRECFLQQSIDYPLSTQFISLFAH